MATSISTLSSVLKQFYLGPIAEQLNQEIRVLSLFDTMTVDWSGKVAIFPLHVSRNTGVGAVAEGGTLPTAGNEGYVNLTISAAYVYGRFQFTGPAMAAAAKAAGSYGTITQLEMDKLVQDVKHFANNVALTGGGLGGFVWQKSNALTTFQYSGRYADVAVGGANTVSFFRTDTYAQVGIATQVTAISQNSITIAANIDTSALPVGVVVAVALNGVKTDASAFTAEPNGIFGNLASQSHFGIDRSQAGNAILRSNFALPDPTSAQYNPLSLDSLQHLMDVILEASGKEIDRWWLNPVQRQSYTTLLVGTAGAHLFTTSRGDATKGDGGFTSLGYGNKPMETSIAVPKGSIVAMETKSWKKAVLSEGEFAEWGGDILAPVPNTDAYQGYYRMYYNTVCIQPNANGILTGVDFLA